MVKQSQVTQLLTDWRNGNQGALNDLLPLVHDTMRQLANKYMRGENPGHTLQATALVNEAFLRLVDVDVPWQNRAHFLAVAAQTMRRILIDHAKSKRREKRGGDALRVTLHETQLGDTGAEPDILDLEDALNQLSKFDQRKAQVVELSFFGGMTYDEVGETLSISPATVDRELRFAKAWLYRELNPDHNNISD